MDFILDRIAAEHRSDFRPINPTEYFALRLASRLGEPQTARHFSLLASEHGIEKLAAAYQRIASNGENLGRRFHQELRISHRNGTQAPSTRLAGIRVERRSIGAVMFRDLRIEAVRVRQLPSNPSKAEASAAGFVNQLVRDHGFESAAVEATAADEAHQRAAVTGSVRRQLRENSISLWDLNRKTVAAAFGHPPLKTRTDLQKVIREIWPQMNVSDSQLCVLDAAALGLFIQTERLFNHF